MADAPSRARAEEQQRGRSGGLGVYLLSALGLLLLFLLGTGPAMLLEMHLPASKPVV